MGQRGPLPKPTAVHEAQGTARADRNHPGEPRPEVKAPACPAWLSKEAKAEWKRQVRHLLAVRCVAEMDRALLAAYCETWARYVECVTDLGENGLLLPRPDGTLAENPAAARRDRALEQLVKLADRFGFAPATRARCRSVPAGEGGAGGKPTLYKIRD